MKVPFIDFSQQYQAIKNEIDKGLKAVFEKGNFILGEEEQAFEKDFASYCGAKYGVGVNSGTDALYLALGALHVGAGDEVIVPTYTFIATALCISYTGATPVFIEVEEETYNLDPKKLEKLITKKTKAIIPVHLYGQPANMDEIMSVARKHKLAVVEDAAQSHGAAYKGKKVGALGDVACFSFYPTKSLGAFGDGGMVVTNREDIFERVQMLRDYGRVGRYEHKVKGFNSRLDTVQAVILSAKLKYLDQWNTMRAAHAAYYNKLLSRVDGVVTPMVKKDRTHVYQTYAVRIPHRDHIIEQMKQKGVSVLIHYPIPIHLQVAYKDAGYKRNDFPFSEKLASEILSLPMYPHINEEQIEYVCASLEECLETQKACPTNGRQAKL